jgi:hypothetical protein
MAEKIYVSSSSRTEADLTWEEKNDSSYLLKKEVVKELQEALRAVKEHKKARAAER